MKPRIFYEIAVMHFRKISTESCNTIEFAVQDINDFLDKAIECGALSIGELQEYVEEHEND